MQPGKTKNQNRPLRTYRTYPPDARLERGWAGGKRSQSQNAELSMQVREPRMDDNRASAADNHRKLFPSCVGSEKFSPLLSRTENTIFVSFTAFSQRILLLFSTFCQFGFFRRCDACVNKLRMWNEFNHEFKVYWSLPPIGSDLRHDHFFFLCRNRW